MAERNGVALRNAQASTESYIKDVAGKGNAAEQIATAKGLLDQGTITTAEFEQLKAKALA
jgi:hypothetical protein